VGERASFRTGHKFSELLGKFEDILDSNMIRFLCGVIAWVRFRSMFLK
jgi:hypothetical protein